MKTLIIYNQTSPGVDCSDAIVAAWVFDRVLRRGWDNYDILGWSDRLNPPDTTGYEHVFLLNFSFPRNVIDLWTNNNKQVHIFVHHGSTQVLLGAQSRFSEKFEFVFDPIESSATLTWRYFNSFTDRKMPAFLGYVRDRELEKSEDDALPMSKEINAVFDNMRSELQKTAEATGLPARDLIFTAFDYFATLTGDDLIELFADYWH